MSWDFLPKSNLQYFLQKLKGKFDLKVDKVNGKGLSTNDYTTTEKNKLAGISANATKVESSETNGNIKIDGTETPVYDDSELQSIVSDETTDVTGNPINFSTKSAQNAKNTVINMEPIQNLHGFGKPWVGGAGKNVLPMTVEGIKAANASGTWSGNAYTLNNVTFTILTDSDNNVIGIKVVTSGTLSNPVGFFLENFELGAGQYILNGSIGGSSQTYRINLYDIPAYTTLAQSFDGDSNTITFNQTTALTVRIFVSGGNTILYPMIRKSTDPATFEPYTNIASISGYDEVNINGCGKNLLPLTVEDIKRVNSSSGSWSGNVYTLSNTVFTLLTKENSNIVTGIKVSGTSSVNIFFNISDRKFDIDSLIQSYSTKTVNNYSLSTGLENEGSASTYYAGYDYTTFKTFIKIVANYNPNDMVFKPIMSYNDPNAVFEPYQESNDLTISLGQTVYGATLDVENGILVVTDKVRLFGDLAWATGTDATSQYFKTETIDDITSSGTTSAMPQAICENYAPAPSNNVKNGDFAIGMAGHIVYVRDISIADTTEFVSRNATVKICYKLATPTTIQLTPHEISLLEGVNNISIDDANSTITLTYRDGRVATLDDISAPFKFVIDPTDGGVNIVLKK